MRTIHLTIVSSAPSGCLQTYEFTLIRHVANSTLLAHGPSQPLKLHFFFFSTVLPKDENKNESFIFNISTTFDHQST